MTSAFPLLPKAKILLLNFYYQELSSHTFLHIFLFYLSGFFGLYPETAPQAVLRSGDVGGIVSQLKLQLGWWYPQHLPPTLACQDSQLGASYSVVVWLILYLAAASPLFSLPHKISVLYCFPLKIGFSPLAMWCSLCLVCFCGWGQGGYSSVIQSFDQVF